MLGLFERLSAEFRLFTLRDCNAMSESEIQSLLEGTYDLLNDILIYRTHLSNSLFKKRVDELFKKL